MKKIYVKIEAFARDKMKEERVTGMDHTLRVWGWCKILGSSEDVDMEVLKTTLTNLQVRMQLKVDIDDTDLGGTIIKMFEEIKEKTKDQIEQSARESNEKVRATREVGLAYM